MIAKQKLSPVVVIFLITLSSSLSAQLFRGSEAPGLLAQKRLIAEPHLGNWSQPVSIVVSGGGANIAYWDGKNQSYTPIVATNGLLGMRVGPVYGLKVETVFRGQSITVYPSIEMLDRLYPPQSLATRHPVKIVLTSEELELASSGSMVTKVIYLEDPLTALPFQQAYDHLETVDLGQAQDPFIVADRLGRPMAIVRIGSRVPDLNQNRQWQTPNMMFADANYISEQVTGCGPDCVCNTCQSDIGCCYQEYLKLPKGRRDEYICDGNDRGFNAFPNEDWSINGLDIEDTVAHFDTLDGKVGVTPSNRVCIYSPRFASVRRLLAPNYETVAQKLNVVDRSTDVKLAKSSALSSTALQNVQLQSNKLTQRPNQFTDHTRGVQADSVTKLFGTRHFFKPFEDLQLVRFGEHSMTQDARLSLAMQSAVTWNSDLSAQISVNKSQPIIVNDVNSAREVVAIESKGDSNLRLCKLASTASAQSGDTVDFTIRFDNIGRDLIGNVTIIDNLSPRLAYLDGSVECSVKADFKTETNSAGSLTLRWEIEEPLGRRQGGIIRFQCRVR